MDIGTAKLPENMRQGIKHYLIDCLSPKEEFNVVRFVELAKEAIQNICQKGKLPIVVGGTGFYIQALLYDIDFTEQEHDDSYRKELAAFAEKKGAEALHDKLKEVDPKAAEQIHFHNVKRVIRALEFYHQSGLLISQHNERERMKESPYDFFYFVLNDDRERLYERINHRVDQMLSEGLEKEVLALKNKGYTKDMVSMQGLGYKEMLDYLDGECSLETRHFAKRQITWFKREKDVIWINKKACDYDENKILNTMLTYMEGVICYRDYSEVRNF